MARCIFESLLKLVVSIYSLIKMLVIMAVRSIFPRDPLLKEEMLFKWDDEVKNNNNYLWVPEPGHNKLSLICYQWDIYATGYKYAADLAVENGLRPFKLDFKRYYSISDEVDVLTGPVVFLYRQYLEVRLKTVIVKDKIIELIKSGTNCIPDGEDEAFLTDKQYTHDLSTIWKECRKIIEKLHDDPDPEDLMELDIMEEYIKEYTEMDKGSFTFRYPIGKGTGQLHSYKHRQFSLLNLYEVMDKIFHYLEEQNQLLNGTIEYEEDCLQCWGETQEFLS